MERDGARVGPLAVLGQNANSRTARRRVVTLAIAEVARYLGNTPTVCRSSYVDPRVIDRFDAGHMIVPRRRD